MDELNINELPDYLKNSDYVQNNKDLMSNNKIAILSKYNINFDDTGKITINNKRQFLELLDKLRYWMVNDIPDSVYDYLFLTTDENNIVKVDDLSSVFKDFYYDELIVIIRNRNESQLAIMNKAVDVESLNLIKYLRHQNYEWNETTVMSAVFRNNLEITKYLYDNGCKFPLDSLSYLSHTHGMECWEFVHDKCSIEWKSQTCFFAAVLGRLDILQFAIKHDKEIDEKVFKAAVSIDSKLQPGVDHRLVSTPEEQIKLSINMLKFLHKNTDVPLTHEIINEASAHGNLEAVKYLQENDCVWTSNVTNSAAIRNRPKVLKYLLENGCPHDRYTCMYAAENGNLECLKITHEFGCEWDWKCLNFSAANGYPETLKYAYENGCQFSNNAYTGYPCEGAILASSHPEYGNQHLECLKYSVEIMNCPLKKKSMITAAQFGNIKALKYLHELYQKNNDLLDFDKQIIIKANIYDNPECLEYLRHNNFPEPTQKEIHDAKIKKDNDKPIIMTRQSS